MSVTDQQSTKTYEREAEATRNRLSSSLDELAASLTPGTVLDEVLTYARAGGGDFLRGLGKSASANPIPTLLIGLGAAMFLTGRGRIDGSPNGSGYGGGVLRHAAGMMRRRTSPDYADAGPEAHPAGPGYRAGSAGGGAGVGSASGASRAADAAMGANRSAASTVSRAASGVGTAAANAAGAVGSTASGAASAVGSAATATADTVGSAAASAADAVGSTASRAADRIRSGASAVGSAASDAASTVRNTAAAGMVAVGDVAASTSSFVADTVGAVGDSATAVAESASSLAGAASTTAAEHGQRLFDQTSRYARVLNERTRRLIQEQPLAVAAAGLALGAALAAALPRTQTEDTLLGKTSDEIKDTLAGAATEQFQRAKEATSRVVEETKSAAEKEGLSVATAANAVRDVGEKVKHVVAAAGSELTKDAKQAADEQVGFRDSA
jgi:hypothetical protein